MKELFKERILTKFKRFTDCGYDVDCYGEYKQICLDKGMLVLESPQAKEYLSLAKMKAKIRNEIQRIMKMEGFKLLSVSTDENKITITGITEDSEFEIKLAEKLFKFVEPLLCDVEYNIYV